jgi:hypothetical protein
MTSLANLSDCILFIDMPNLGGGTTFFVKSLISHYSANTTFLVARVFYGKLRLSINHDDLDKTYTSAESIQLLDKIAPKIKFIFVNHIIDHKKSFLQKLFKLGKKVVTITHDYLLLFKVPTMTFDQYLSKDFSLQTNLNIDQFDSIITQNIGNMYIYHKYMSSLTKKKVRIMPLPDYTKSLKKVTIPKSRHVIRVGILGFISDVKGSDIVKEFINKTRGTNIELVIFGTLFNSDYPHQYPYSSISQLNQFLTDLKPNLLIETSICPETYSYTLTLGMLTRLPILYYRKPIPCVVSDRLSYYPKSYECKSVRDMLIKTKCYYQNYFYTIDDKSFSYGKKWDKLFL